MILGFPILHRLSYKEYVSLAILIVLLTSSSLTLSSSNVVVNINGCRYVVSVDIVEGSIVAIGSIPHGFRVYVNSSVELIIRYPTDLSIDRVIGYSMYYSYSYNDTVLVVRVTNTTSNPAYIDIVFNAVCYNPYSISLMHLIIVLSVLALVAAVTVAAIVKH